MGKYGTSTLIIDIELFLGTDVIWMPPNVMETIFGLLGYPNITWLWWSYSSMHKLLGLPSKLSELLPDKMELGQNGLFYWIWIRSSDSSKHWVKADKKNYIARYPAGEGSLEQNFRAMDQEGNSADPLIFQSVAKIS